MMDKKTEDKRKEAMLKFSPEILCMFRGKVFDTYLKKKVEYNEYCERMKRMKKYSTAHKIMQSKD